MARKLKTYQASLGFFHVEGSELVRESAIEPREADRLFQFPVSLVDVRASQNSLQFAVVDQNSGSLRGWRAEVALKATRK